MVEPPGQLVPGSSKGPFAEILTGIEDEIEAIERDPSRSFDVSGGRRLHRGIGGSLYTFRAELSIPLAAETPLSLHAGGERHRGTLVAVDDFDVVVHLRADIGEDIPTALVSTEPAFILEALKDRLLSVGGSKPGGLPEAGLAALVAGVCQSQDGSDAELAGGAAAELARLSDPGLVPNASQLGAMSRIAGSDLHFVWGPPGTGKTAALAQVARMLASNGQRILVLAHANVAIDVAMVRVADALRDMSLVPDGRLVRVGTPHHPDAIGREEILLDSIVARLAPERALEISQLEARRRRLVASLRGGADGDPDVLAAELKQVREHLSAARDKLKDVANEIIQRASVVGSTLSRFVLSDPLWNWRPDAVLLDEASMVSFPWVLAAAARLGKRLVIFGDFRQLPPVYQARSDLAHRWMGRDVFDVAGVRERIDAGEDDPRVTLLETQYRMASPIGDAVSKLAYAGRLTTDPSADQRAGRFSDALPWPDEPLVLVDTSLLEPASQIEAKVGSYSRLNLLHLALGVTMAAESELETALITPYRAQARLFAAAGRSLGLEQVTAATIHRFQGSERDAVIFDMVDAPPADGPSRLTGGDIDLALRLANVGLSRARAKAIVMANLELIESRFAPASPVRRLIDLCGENGIVVRPQPSEIEAISTHAWNWSTSWAETEERLEADVTNAQRSVVVNLPPGVDLSGGVINALIEADARGVRTLVLVGFSTAQRLEKSTIDLRLRPLPSAFALIDEDRILLGGRGGRIFASASSTGLGSCLRSVLVPDIAASRNLGRGSSGRELTA